MYNVHCTCIYIYIYIYICTHVSDNIILSLLNGATSEIEKKKCVYFCLYNIIKILNIIFTMIYKLSFLVKYNYKIKYFKSISFK